MNVSSIYKTIFGGEVTVVTALQTSRVIPCSRYALADSAYTIQVRLTLKAHKNQLTVPMHVTSGILEASGMGQSQRYCQPYITVFLADQGYRSSFIGCASCITLVYKVSTFVTGKWSVLQIFLPSGIHHSRGFNRLTS